MKKDGVKDEEGPVGGHRSGLGLAVLIVAALALGSFRRRLASRVYRQGHSSQGDGGVGSTRSQEYWDEYIEEELRKERIRRMQQAFHRGKAQKTRTYEKWEEHPTDGDSGQHRDDSHDTSKSAGSPRSQAFRRAGLLRHFEVLGLDPRREKPYSDAELKTAFREKAKLHHPDRNMNRKVESEQKFREAMDSYEALRSKPGR